MIEPSGSWQVGELTVMSSIIIENRSKALTLRNRIVDVFNEWFVLSQTVHIDDALSDLGIRVMRGLRETES
jgi:hypothetical protein